MRDVLLDHVTLATSQWERPLLQRVHFGECRLTGMTVIEGKLEHTVFAGCTAQLAAFRFTTFKVARFERCILTEADFQGTDLSGVVFYQCDLTGAQLSGARLVGTDFRGSTIDGLRVGPNELPGAIVDTGQAILLAKVLGVEVMP